jgi:uncharacterized membrane protein
LPFWYDFLIGDDWTVAVAVVVAIALTALLSRTTTFAWLVLPITVAAILGLSVWRAASSSSSDPGR